MSPTDTDRRPRARRLGKLSCALLASTVLSTAGISSASEDPPPVDPGPIRLQGQVLENREEFRRFRRQIGPHLIELSKKQEIEAALEVTTELVRGWVHFHGIDSLNARRTLDWQRTFLHLRGRPRWFVEGFYTADKLQDKARILASRGQLEKASRAYSRSFIGLSLFLDEPLGVTAQLLQEHSDVEWKLGNVDRALTLARASPDYFTHALGYWTEPTANAYNSLGVILQDSGYWAEAKPMFLRALEIYDHLAPGSMRKALVCEANLAFHLWSIGEKAEAEAAFRKTLASRAKMAEKYPTSAGRAHCNLARVLLARGKKDEVPALLQRAFVLFERPRSKPADERRRIDSLSEAWAISSTLLKSQGDLEGARDSSRRSLEVLHPEFDDEHHELSEARLRLSRIELRLGDADRAIKLLGKAIPAFEKQRRYFLAQLMRSRDLLGEALELRGDLDAAEAAFRQSAIDAEELRSHASHTGLGRVEFLSRHRPVPRLAACLARQGRAVDAWNALENTLSRGLLDELAGGLLESQNDSALRAARRHLERTLESLRQARARGGRDATPNEIDRLEARWRAALARVDDLLLEQRRQLGAVIGSVRPIDEVAALLAPDVAVVVWLDQRATVDGRPETGRHWAFVLRARRSPDLITLEGSQTDGAWSEHDEGLAYRVRSVLESRGGQASDKIASLLDELREQRWTPLAAALGPRDTTETGRQRSGDSTLEKRELPPARRIICIPSGNLRDLPLEVLDAEREMLYAPSASVWAHLLERHRARQGTRGPDEDRSFLLVGDPVYPEGSRFATLPASRKETEGIASIVRRAGHRADLLLGAEANEDALQTLASDGRLRDRRVLHLATHCTANLEQGLDSSLWLSPSADDDGRISARQILRTWKLDADLVTLSACETGQGSKEAGEGRLGFTQAVLGAGASSVLLSRWKVDDTATALLMQRFYANWIGRGQPPPTALHEAKHWLRNLRGKQARALLRGGDRDKTDAYRDKGRDRTDALLQDKVWADPVYWAAWVLVGTGS